MGILDRLARRFGFIRQGKKRGIGYAAAEMGRLTASLRSDTEFINTTLRTQLRTLRARSRAATQNNPFARRFRQMCIDNIAGPVPFKIEGCVKNRSGKPDEANNELIEAAWCAFSKKGQCEITGKWSMNAVLRLLVGIWATDGEILLRVYKGPEYGSFGLKLQVIDIDRLWELKNEALKDGGAIHMSVEVDSFGKPVAYHIMKRKPSSWQTGGQQFEFERVPANEIIHLFIPEFAEQVRGVPWMYAALLNLVHMGAFEEAAVINARIGASQMGFITTPDGEGPAADAKDASGNAEFDAEPGTFRKLADGETVESWDPAFPQAAVEPFIKAMLRGVAAGLGVAYHNLANDLEGVNYSSARIGELDERDSWMVLQSFFEEHFLQPFATEHWMPQAIMAGKLPFKLEQLDKFTAFYFQARRWQWVDPLKEMTARIMAKDNLLTSRTRILAEAGEEWDDVMEELEIEDAAIKKAGLESAPPAGAKPKEPDEDDNAAAADSADSADTTPAKKPKGK